jgi:hypothetical protein
MVYLGNESRQAPCTSAAGSSAVILAKWRVLVATIRSLAAPHRFPAAAVRLPVAAIRFLAAAIPLLPAKLPISTHDNADAMHAAVDLQTRDFPSQAPAAHPHVRMSASFPRPSPSPGEGLSIPRPRLRILACRPAIAAPGHPALTARKNIVAARFHSTAPAAGHLHDPVRHCHGWPSDCHASLPHCGCKENDIHDKEGNCDGSRRHSRASPRQSQRKGPHPCGPRSLLRDIHSPVTLNASRCRGRAGLAQ